MRITSHMRAISRFLPKDLWIAFLVFLFSLLLTGISVNYIKNLKKNAAIQNFVFDSSEIQNKMETRLLNHAQLLRSGVALFATTDTVTREQWNQFYNHAKVQRYLPGLQGFGYSTIITPREFSGHSTETRKDAYTTVIYLEPSAGKNLKLFGQDLYSVDVHRQAMEVARDSAFAVLSGRIPLIQEMSEANQAEILMYIPVYRRNMPVTTVSERRAAIQGWVFSPYRIDYLIEGILGYWDYPGPKRIHLMIYDSGRKPEGDPLYDSQPDKTTEKKALQNLSVTLPVRLNNNEWTMVLTRRSDEFSLLNSTIIMILVSGIIISLLLFLLTLSLLKTKKLNRDKVRFISILGHDLRSPFNSLLGFLEILNKDFHTLGEEKVQQYLNYTHTVAKNTYSLLENLIEWSRTQSGKIQFKPELVNIKDLCNDVQHQINPGARAKDIRMKYQIDENTKLYADPDMIKTILRNLCTNAIKFSHRGGEVIVRAVQDERQVLLAVSDSGVGMEPDKLSNLFKNSHLVTSRGTSSEPGTGLGLIICQELIKIHGASIRAESEPGKGTTFYCHFEQTIAHHYYHPEKSLA
jgi:signal transduction histidine kinase